MPVPSGANCTVRCRRSLARSRCCVSGSARTLLAMLPAAKLQPVRGAETARPRHYFQFLKTPKHSSSAFLHSPGILYAVVVQWFGRVFGFHRTFRHCSTPRFQQTPAFENSTQYQRVGRRFKSTALSAYFWLQIGVSLLESENIHSSLFIYLSIHLSLSLYLSNFLSLYPSIHPSVRPSIYR
jgi:hypothetical protein